ncbi:beta-phosphoglucomutase family hydrolase [Kocuria sp. cx-116]|uniref:beta-phosphoglucomutase family hydrolase n=1 Tax=Kocuria sp. cx-116 TaxID=2771378 RepID=UPI001683BCC4|nr:beta-phosphoglucomutase family hydrolase [Kocuria sp. cx-116]MBD2762812.1 beta-phosphoglucomutase family hydrolase [Kocuria sp. cx-116]
MNVLPTAPFTASMPRITEERAPSAPVDVLRTRYSAVIFDMDGVVTDTASVHARAWQQLFDAILLDERLQPAEPGGQIDRSAFDVLGEYRTYVDGRRREDGVRALLAARGAMLPEARNDEEPQAGDWTVQGQAATKDGFFHAELKEHGVRVFPRTVQLIERLQTAGVPVGLVTASRNSGVVLAAAGLSEIFDEIVDGNMAAQQDLPGKPAPYTFLECARLLNVPAENSVVIEDAVAGVQAGVAGGFGLVVGINRDSARDRLYRAGAHVVLNDVGELDLGALRDDPWTLAFEGFDPASEPRREALLTLANGYMGVRGAASEFPANDVHYPGTYLAGVFNRVQSNLNGRDAEHESMVNTPNWLHLDLRFAEGEWWSEGGMRPSKEHVALDLRRGLLTRTLTLSDHEPSPDGTTRSLDVVQRRLVSLRYRHLGAQETTLIPRNFSGRLHVRTGIDPTVTNSGVAEYKELNAHHLMLLESTTLPDEHETLLSLVRTTQSKIEIAMAQRTRIDSDVPSSERREMRPGGIEFRRHLLQVTADQPVIIDSTTAVVTSRDAAISSPRGGALSELDRNPFGVRKLLASHEIEWARLWDRYEVTLDAAEDTPESRGTQLAVRAHLFHTAQTLAPHLSLRDAGVPARGLHGEGYRGHIFWDELFILPVVNMRHPHVTRSLLSYRWRRLAMARHRAQELGLYGTAFPWQSGSDGREETPPELYNHHSRRWLPDNSWRQFHVGLAIAYNAWVYYESTGDIDWLSGHGSELIIGITRLFASLAEYDSHDGKYHIAGVMGPDEYHDGPAGQHGGGLKDNAYTNVLASWLFRHSAHIFHDMVEHQREELESRFEISGQEVQTWLNMAKNMYVPFNSDGTISQFEGYDGLAELDWDFYRTKYHNIGRLDLLLENEGDLTNNYKLTKQADTIMLVYLLGPEGVVEELARMGYTIDHDTVQRTVDHYIARSSNGSSLSRVVNAAVLAWLDPDRSWGSFQDALMVDLDDTQGGTTGEGIHLGAMAGSVDVITRAYAGLRVRGDWLEFRPTLPRELQAVDFTVLYRGQVIEVSIDQDILELEGTSSKADPVTIHVNGAEYVLKGGQKISVSLKHRASRRPEKALARLRRQSVSGGDDNL